MLSTPIIMVAGVVYPAYSTFKATQKGADAAETTRWLHYWMIFAAFSTIEWLVDMVGAYLPFYFEAKLMFVLWLVMARFKGATTLCTKYAEPLLIQHQAAIDEQLSSLSSKVSNFTVDDVGAFVNWVTAKAESYTNAGATKGAPKPATASAAAPAAAPKPAAAKAPEVPQEKPQEPDETHETVNSDDAVDGEEKKEK